MTDLVDRAGEVEQAQRDDALRRARGEPLPGPSAKWCDTCGERIPEARRKAVPGVQHCVECRERIDRRLASAGWGAD